MRRLGLTLAATVLTVFACGAQNLTETQKAALDAAQTINGVALPEPEIKKPVLWTNSVKSTINFGQTALTNWAAGGNNSYSLKGYVDASANYQAQDKNMFWKNRLQLDYGIMYSSDKPLMQKSDDRIYLESKWGYKMVEKWYFSADFSFKSQFAKGYTYKTPATKKDENGNTIDPSSREWKDARVLKSNLLSPGYVNLALGIDWTAAKWLTVNIAPLSAALVTVTEEALRKSYSMPEKGSYTDADGKEVKTYKSARFDLGAQIKADVSLKVNNNFSYKSQLVLFSNYLKNPENLRVNWDNRFEWKLAKYFALCVATNLIYDDTVMIKNDKDLGTYPDGRARVQFKESLTFGFTYTIANKK